jgi:hypothetical protein
VHDEDVTHSRRRCCRSVLAVAAAAAAVGLTACGGGSPGSPHVANLGGASNDSGSTTSPPIGNPTHLLDQWASCMRAHGDPDQADPTIDANKVIHITYPASVNPQQAGQEGARQRLNAPCQALLTAASTALGGAPPTQPSQAELDKFSECMRVNAVLDFPDLTENSSRGVHLGFTPGSDLNPNSPAFQNAEKVCDKETGVQGPGGTASVGPGQIAYSAGG